MKKIFIFKWTLKTSIIITLWVVSYKFSDCIPNSIFLLIQFFLLTPLGGLIGYLIYNLLKTKDINFKNTNNSNWYKISKYQKLSEEFIEKFQDKVNWVQISGCLKLSEQFIEKFQDNVDWFLISEFQKLSEEFIEKFQDKVNWNLISACQKLSENFIEKFQDKVDWELIAVYQKLSEQFIENFQNKVYWIRISQYQKLSENFIEKFQDNVDWEDISKYQKLSQGFIKKSQGFIKKYNLKVPENNMFYFTKEQKLNLLNSGEGNPYEMDGEHLIAYKATRHDGFSVFNFQYQYEVGKTYESHADGNLGEENSFGLSAWTKEEAINYHNNGELYKIKVHLDDVVAIVHKKKKLRCSRIEVIEKIY